MRVLGIWGARNSRSHKHNSHVAHTKKSYCAYEFSSHWSCRTYEKVILCIWVLECDMTHIICGKWLIRMCNITHSNARRLGSSRAAIMMSLHQNVACSSGWDVSFFGNKILSLWYNATLLNHVRDKRRSHSSDPITLQHTATHCNTLQRTATHYNTFWWIRICSSTHVACHAILYRAYTGLRFLWKVTHFCA